MISILVVMFLIAATGCDLFNDDADGGNLVSLKSGAAPDWSPFLTDGEK